MSRVKPHLFNIKSRFSIKKKFNEICYNKKHITAPMFSWAFLSRTSKVLLVIKIKYVLHTHTHTHIYRYMVIISYIYICACICIYDEFSQRKFTKLQINMYMLLRGNGFHHLHTRINPYSYIHTYIHVCYSIMLQEKCKCAC